METPVQVRAVPAVAQPGSKALWHPMPVLSLLQDMQAQEVDTATSSAMAKYCCCQESAMKLAVQQWSLVARTAHNWAETPCWPPAKPHP